MGYYTRYTLTIKNIDFTDVENEKVESLVKELRETNNNARCCLNEFGESSEEAKWYDSLLDISSFSEKHPVWIFILRGEGEESGDIWTTYFYNGNAQKAKTKIVASECDLEKLKANKFSKV